MAKTKEPVKKRVGKCYISERKYRNLRNYFEECTGSSALHGVKYLGESNRTLAEKVVWLSIIVVSITCCAYFVLQTYRKWESTPILVTVGTTQLPIQYVTFPAVTICPATKITTDMIDFMEKFEDNNAISNLTTEEILRFKHSQMWCYYKDYTKFNNTFSLNETYGLNTLDFICNNTPSMDVTFWMCYWSNSVKPCSKIFTPTLTEDGICYTFNSIDRSNLFEIGVLPFRDFNTARNTSCYYDYNGSCEDTYPYRTTPGAEAGLQVFLRVPKEYSNPCMDTSKGHKVMIHQPNELPSTKNNYFFIPLDESVTAALSPQVITTDESLKSYTVEQRKCYYDDEKNLTHFKYYSQRNCENECYIYILKFYMNCSDFYMPHIDPNVTICNATNSFALREKRHHLANHLAQLNLNIPEYLKNYLKQKDVPEEAREICSCLPSCRSLKYDAEITQTNYDIHDKQERDLHNTDAKYTKLSVYFKDAQFIPYERKEMFGLMDFVAYCGGLLGLFIGFSFIAWLEIMYFIFFRPLCNIFLYGRKYWAGIYKAQIPNNKEGTVSSD